MSALKQPSNVHRFRRLFKTLDDGNIECRNCSWAYRRSGYTQHLDHLEDCLKGNCDFIALCKEEEEWYRSVTPKKIVRSDEREPSVVSKLLAAGKLRSLYTADWFPALFPDFSHHVPGVALPPIPTPPFPPHSSSLEQKAHQCPGHPLYHAMLQWASLEGHNEPGLQRIGTEVMEYLLLNPQCVVDISDFSMDVSSAPHIKIHDVETDARQMARAGLSVSAYDIRTSTRIEDVAIESILASMNEPVHAQWGHQNVRYGLIDVPSHPLGSGKYRFEWSVEDPAFSFRTIQNAFRAKSPLQLSKLLKLLQRPGESEEETKKRINVSSTLTPAGNVSVLHVDGPFGFEIHHIEGEKIWCVAEMTEGNWEYWKQNGHPSSSSGHLDALRNLDQVRVFHVREPCRWILNPFSIHFVISLTKAAHAGALFYPTSNLDDYVMHLWREVQFLEEIALDVLRDSQEAAVEMRNEGLPDPRTDAGGQGGSKTLKKIEPLTKAR
ncbi:hypothetical protein C8J56DRAFT_1173961 [Mycena floridula]|nr:hypothetical protein C8J56DRAFT_1173961 [Mycena floridula]